MFCQPNFLCIDSAMTSEKFIKGIIRPSRREFIKGAAAMAAMAALPPAATAIGNFGNGSTAAAASSGPAQPAAARSAGFNKLTFYDDFTSLSTIDVNNTLQPGFNWYVQWPETFNSSLPLTIWPPSCFSISGSVLTFSPTDQISGGSKTGGELVSAAFLGTGPQYVGNLIKPTGFYAESYIQFGTSPGLSNNWFPAFWCWDGFIPQHLAYGTAYGSNRYTEMDIMEYEGSFDRQLFDYSNAGTIGTTNFSFSIANPNNWHKYGLLWIPQSENAGTGTMETYVDGALLSANTIDYSSSTIPPQAGSGATTGYLSGSDTSTLGFTFQLQTGFQWPLNVDYVQVWQ
jgi:hypothetical protein